jgi:competence protein ComEC
MQPYTVREWIRRHPLLLIVLILFVFDALLLFVSFSRERGMLRVSFLNVGQGDAVFIEAPNGNQLLYDAGPPSGAVLRALGEVLPFWDRSIDVAVFSHPDQDHIGGFLDVIDRYKVSVVLEPGASSTNGVWAEAERSITDHHIAHLVARKGMQIDLGGGVQADILYPDRDMTYMETNSASIVMRIHYGATSFLVSGDLPKNIEEYEVAMYGDALHATVLKLGHHGSRTSSSEVWLHAVAPDVAVASAGKGNRYGHPHQEVLDLLAKLHIPHLVTFTEGTITFASDGKVVVRK